jgi:hypothetical protein
MNDLGAVSRRLEVWRIMSRFVVVMVLQAKNSSSNYESESWSP